MIIKSLYYTDLDDTMEKFELDNSVRSSIEATAQKAEEDFLLFTLSLI